MRELVCELAPNNAYGRYNGVELVDIEKDRAVMKTTVTPDMLNPFGIVHGGLYFTLADCTTGAAVHTDGRKHVTLSSNFNFCKSVSEGVLLATAEVYKRGSSITLSRVRVECEGQLLAEGTFTYFCIG